MTGIGYSMQGDIRNVYTIFYVKNLDRRNEGNEILGFTNGEECLEKNM
jgi:hypothetical protein